MPKLLILNADDLGICHTTNLAIRDAHQQGVLTSASLLSNSSEFEQAVEDVILPNRKLGVGIHLSLTSGASLSKPSRIPLLVDGKRRFRHGFLSLYRTTLAPGHGFLSQIEMELCAQFERVRAAGLPIDHVNGHRYIHMIPAIFRIITRLATRYGVPAVRFPRESLNSVRGSRLLSRWSTWARNLPKWGLLKILTRRNQVRAPQFCRTNAFYGLLDSGCVDIATLKTMIASLPDGVTEIVTHPSGHRPSVAPDWTQADRRFLHSRHRWQEREALMAPEVRQCLEEHNIQLVRFCDIPPDPHTVHCAAVDSPPDD